MTYENTGGILKQQKVLAYKNRKDQMLTVAGEMLARRMISTCCNVAPADISFEIGSYGKPNAKQLDVEFNISHSYEMVVCAISDNPVGIDAEKIRPIGTSILRRLCTDVDLEYIFGNNTTTNNIPSDFDEQQLHRFYEVWTAKEAYFKCIGTGIENLKSVTFEELVKRRILYNIGEYLITIIEK